MLMDGIELFDGSKAKNLSVDSGESLPVSGLNIGELFLLINDNQKNLHVYTSIGWLNIPTLNDVNTLIENTPSASNVIVSTSAPVGIPRDGDQWIVV